MAMFICVKQTLDMNANVENINLRNYEYILFGLDWYLLL